MNDQMAKIVQALAEIEDELAENRARALAFRQRQAEDSDRMDHAALLTWATLGFNGPAPRTRFLEWRLPPIPFGLRLRWPY